MVFESPLSGDVTPVVLGEASLADAFALSAAAGWNQVDADWRMMLACGESFGYAARDGRLIASAVILPYGGSFGWISMVLVDRAWRRRGLATKLLGRCIERLESLGLAPVLDATPDGATVYEKLGFKPVFPLTRWQRDGSGSINGKPSEGSGLQGRGVRTAIAYDREVFGGSRSEIIASLATRAGGLGRVSEDGRGFLLARDGREALQIGPLFADDPEWALEALDDALHRVSSSVCLDVPDCHADVAKLLQESGFRVQRTLTRMVRGALDTAGDPSRMFVVAGPELG